MQNHAKPSSAEGLLSVREGRPGWGEFDLLPYGSSVVAVVANFQTWL